MDRTRAEDKRNGGRGAGRIRDRERTFGPASEIAARNFRSVRDLSALARKRARTVVEITARRRSKRDLLSIEWTRELADDGTFWEKPRPHRRMNDEQVDGIFWYRLPLNLITRLSAVQFSSAVIIAHSWKKRDREFMKASSYANTFEPELNRARYQYEPGSIVVSVTKLED